MSRILGVKLTHDAALAYVVDGELIFSVELEKINNNPRHAHIRHWGDFSDIMMSEGLNTVDMWRDVDTVVVDGWKGGHIQLPVFTACAPYHEHDPYPGFPYGNPMGSIQTSVGRQPAVSYPHVTNHLTGSYAMSPWADAHEECYAIMWDGGTGARLYHINPADHNRPIKLTAHLHHYYGYLYGVMGYYAGPYKSQEYGWRKPDLGDYTNHFGRRDWPGKLMSWIAKGTPRRSLMNSMWDFTVNAEQHIARQPGYKTDAYNQNGNLEHRFMRDVMKCAENRSISEEDTLASVHAFLEELLVARAVQYVPGGKNLLFTGGSALNIKWNSALRESGHFAAVFIPPVPNDAGSALGAAITHQIATDDVWSLKWDVFAGPRLTSLEVLPDGWRATFCSATILADEILMQPYNPMVVLNGRAEIGPRALGHRSILCMPGGDNTQFELNEIKGRESWRPVAPICLESDAPKYFSPGTPDPYMLFDHAVKEAHYGTFPAITHLDGTARLQTVSNTTPSLMRTVLTRLAELGVSPVLCNTSANLNGSGFFPDVESAMRWGKVNRIWAEGVLFTKKASE